MVSAARPGRRAYRSRTCRPTRTKRSARTSRQSPRVRPGASMNGRSRASPPRRARRARAPGARARPRPSGGNNQMSTQRVMRCVGSALLAGVLAISAQAALAAKPRIKILATGGTIAGAQASQAEYGYKSGAFKVEDLINAVPQMKEIADITGEQVVNIGSQDMNDEVWLKLGKRVNEVLAGADTDAIVITHGTDTMEETSYFLDLVTKSDKPVVLVGSMRPATGISADGPMNLYTAVAVASDPKAKGRGVLVVINDTIHSARNVAKVNTANVEAFKSPNRGPAGIVNTGKINWF